jgi:hypothetical protein
MDCGFFDDSANRGEKEGQKRRGERKANAHAHANDAERKTKLKLRILRFDSMVFLYSEEVSLYTCQYLQAS